MNKFKVGLIIAASCVIIGAILAYPEFIARSGIVKQSVQTVAPEITKIEVEKPLVSGQPTHIDFPSLDVSVDVTPGYYDAASSTWSVSTDKAQFATVTSEPNNKTGNTFIYGHNRWQVFTKLLDATIGDEAIINTENGHVFKYTLTAIHDTDQTDTSFLQPTEKPTLTVQTCSGLNYEYRRMLSFSFVEVI